MKFPSSLTPHRWQANRFMQTAALVFAAIAVGLFVAKGLSWLVLGALLLAAVMASSSEYKIAAAVLLVFYPFSPGSLGPVPQVLLAELLVPVAFPLVLLAVARSGQPLVPRQGVRYAVAAGVLVVVTAFHLLTGPVLGSVGGLTQLGASGLRPFYNLFVYVLLFFMAVWVLDWVPKTKESWTRVLKTLLVTSLLLALLRLISVGLDINTPLLAGVFDYGGETRLRDGTPFFRIGGLAETATLGLACLSALWAMRVIKPWSAALTALLLLALVGLSGGRSLAIGVAAALFVYFIGPARGRRMQVILSGAALAGITVFAALRYGYAAQIARILALEGGIAQQDPARAEIFNILWGYFLANPLVGKGIGVAAVGLSDSFVASQVVAGGHSSYMSMLGNFGLAGAFFLTIFLFDPIWRSLARTRAMPGGRVHSLAQGLMAFVLVQFVIRAFEYIVGGSGYRDPSLYIVTALFVVILGIGVDSEPDST